jgi:hypothetical protein
MTQSKHQTKLPKTQFDMAKHKAYRGLHNIIKYLESPEHIHIG